MDGDRVVRRGRLDPSENDLTDWRSGDGRVLGARIPAPRDGHLSAAVPPGLSEPAPTGATPPAPTVSDRIVTLPNALSVARIAMVPLFVALVLAWHAPGWGLVLLAVMGITDWLDGKIARLWDMRSKLGETLDPVADRLLVVVVPVVCAVAGYVSWWIVGLLIGRDLVLLATLPVYRRRGIRPSVIYLGKAATFALFWSFPLVLAAKSSVAALHAVGLMGRACLVWGTALYLWSGVLYIVRAVLVGRSGPSEPG